MNLEYYNAKQIATIIGKGLTCAYDLINELNEEMKIKYPNIKIIKHRIPIWYWEEITKGNIG